MNMVKNKIFSIFVWMIASFCLLTGASVALNTTYQVTQRFNYTLAPLGDQAKDVAENVYPVLAGDQSWMQLFQPFADHRITVQRLLIIYDFFFHQGTEEAHPYRVVGVFWFILILLAGIIFSIKVIPLPLRFLLIGCAGAMIFAGISVSNFNLTICFTWPLVILFSLLAFICVCRYIDAYHQHRFSEWAYLFLIFILTILTLFTFNIGLLLWPIIFLILWKNKAGRRHLWWWLMLAAIGHVAYFWSGWHPGITATDHGMINSVIHPIHPFLYLSRILSVPAITTAAANASLGVVILGGSIIFLTLFFLIKFWQLKCWTSSETILFSFLLFNFLTLVVIAVMRSWIEGEYIVVGSRFNTANLMLWLSLFISMSIFYFRSRPKIVFKHFFLSCLIFIWLVVVFLPLDRVHYDASIANQHAIALSTGVPLNDVFLQYSKTYYNGDLNPLNHLYIDNFYRQHRKGIYSLWISQQMKRSIGDLNFHVSECHVLSEKFNIHADLRTKGHPALILQSTLQQLESWSNLMFTDQKGKIVGYGLPVINHASLWERLRRHQPLEQRWQAVINTELFTGQQVQPWLVDANKKKLCKLKTLVNVSIV